MNSKKKKPYSKKDKKDFVRGFFSRGAGKSSVYEKLKDKKRKEIDEKRS